MLLTMLFTLFQIGTLPAPWDQLLLFLGPIITFAVGTYVVPWLRGKINGLWIVGVVIPLLAVLVYILQYFIGLPTLDIAVQVVLNLVAVFFSQVQKKLEEVRSGG